MSAAVAGAGAGSGAGAASATLAGAGGPGSVELGKDGLRKQNRAIDVAVLTPLTPEIISRQATINIGTIGHVAHGKSTTVKALSGVNTMKGRNEQIRNITIKLGYANSKIYKSSAAPWVFKACGSAKADEFPMEDGSGRFWRLIRHISFVDCPGHDILMATMLNGAAIMDAALLLIAASEPCPQPQTSEHLAAVDIMQLKHIIILQNKIDLVKEEQARDQYEKIKSFVTGTVAEGAPIIPVSAQLGYNIDIVAQYIACCVPVPKRDFAATPRLLVIRSFDVNKPGAEIEQLKGGVAGGSITQGVLRVGEEIELRPGITSRTKSGAVRCTPLYTRILSLYAENNDLEIAVPGGLIGIGTQIDPTLTRADRLVGQVLGHSGHLPSVYIRITVKYHLLRRLLGSKAQEGDKSAKVSRLKASEVIMANIGSTSTSATVVSVVGQEAQLELTQPVCTEVTGTDSAKIALSRRIENHWRLIGWGMITDGESIAVKGRD